MKTYFLEKTSNLKVNSLVLGNFDGVHRGHMLLFEAAQNLPKSDTADRLDWAVMTFDPHPKDFFKMEGFIQIYNLEDTQKAFSKAQIPNCIVSNFDESLAYKSPKDFLLEIIEPLSPSAIVIGSDFRFGKNREGSSEDLKSWCDENNANLIVVDLLKNKEETKISSSFIRELLKSGKLEKANELLVSPFFISGKVKREKGLATQLGFPTINFILQKPTPLKWGVYCSEILINGESYSAVTNVGVRPSTDSDPQLSVETFILNFPDKLQTEVFEDVEVIFHKFLRPESRFDSFDELKSQIARDVEQARDYFS